MVNNMCLGKDEVILSIITNTKNDTAALVKTCESLSVLCENKNKVEWVVWNAGRVNVEKHLVIKNGISLRCYSGIDDNGLYDGINRAVLAARGKYVLVLNSGDCLMPDLDDVIGEVCEVIKRGEKVDIFACSVVSWKGKVLNPDISLDYFIHQGLIYRRSIHSQFGGYINISGFTAADYLFFVNVACSGLVNVRVVIKIIAYYARPGLSANALHVMERDVIRASRYKWSWGKLLFREMMSIIRNYLSLFLRAIDRRYR